MAFVSLSKLVRSPGLRGLRYCTRRAVSSSAGGDGSNLSLKLLVFLGSTRPNRMCARVSSYVVRTLEQRGHQVEVVDPVELDLPLLRQPVFAYPPGKAPKVLLELEEKIKAADGYVIVSPEYNHSFSPAIGNTLGHFGGSCFAFKSSSIVTYSIGQFAGIRAAMSLRPFLSELGCLPVSAIFSIAKVGEVFNPDGSFKDGQDDKRWDGYAAKCFGQLEWVGSAFKKHRQVVDPFSSSPPNVKMEDRYMPESE
ncbi:hypothetical protein NDN08_006614 [Rhodosorus marinus]|uniref:NADPH-dependent FMN reductase-like domain-containing protein n=1 Tax=Rhodosorus marinus TaxID=101924 RepID=A0AAV8UL64_9RHOD|nr:hypothetical protein NDN08_006614 [Rhodosorus marinus]